MIVASIEVMEMEVDYTIL
jgi:hypothetical protein